MLIKSPAYYSQLLSNSDTLNQSLFNGYVQYESDDATRRSHQYEGRFENIYIDQDRVPQIETILKHARDAAAEILHMDVEALRAGLWFNAMPPGSRTLKHAHDDDDELLSAVYYVRVPEHSGHLVLHHANFSTHVMPQAGMFVFFPPDVQHEVTENCSAEMRLSLGINIGPVNRLD